MIPFEEFYKNYQANFFKFQQIINKNALENIDYWVEKFKDESMSNDKQQAIQIIKSHIRITYLHCIDTLFELFFGLYPRDKKIQDQYLPLTISKNNDIFNKPRLLGLATRNEETINELNQIINFGENNSTLLQYIIYYQINPDIVDNQDLFIDIADSMDPILDLLSIFANDLSDKSEYNSLKHALRVFPFNGVFNLLNKETLKPIAGIEFIDAHKYIIESKDEIKIITRNFDTERDFSLTLSASKMIWNIIKIRDKFMIKEPCVQNCFVYFFSNKEFDTLERSITNKQKIVHKIKR